MPRKPTAIRAEAVLSRRLQRLHETPLQIPVASVAAAGLESIQIVFTCGLQALGRSNKLIAYELGLAHSTVRVLVARAAEKCGARARAELMARIAASGSASAVPRQ
jgi:DNA-binding NarL/FixJ family response regulator